MTIIDDMTIVRYECGCIGFRPDRETYQSVILEACDGSDGTPVKDRNMGGKSYEPLDGVTRYWQGRLFDAMCALREHNELKYLLNRILK